MDSCGADPEVQAACGPLLCPLCPAIWGIAAPPPVGSGPDCCLSAFCCDRSRAILRLGETNAMLRNRRPERTYWRSQPALLGSSSPDSDGLHGLRCGPALWLSLARSCWSVCPGVGSRLINVALCCREIPFLVALVADMGTKVEQRQRGRHRALAASRQQAAGREQASTVLCTPHTEGLLVLGQLIGVIVKDCLFASLLQSRRRRSAPVTSSGTCSAHAWPTKPASLRLTCGKAFLA